MTNIMAQKYPIGIETFANIIEGGYAYIDKTEVIYRLIDSGNYFFLSRPRRFGKSLMISTMEAYFEGRKELFEGLWLGRAEGINWTPRPVFRLNFVDAEATSADKVEWLIANHLTKWEEKYGITEIVKPLGQRFHNVIEKASFLSGEKVAILIDEYDKVLLNSMHNPELHEEIKGILKPMFAVLKGADRYIDFAILTGVSRFSKLSIFSDINNLVDISSLDKFSTICGFTEDEIRMYFRQGVEAFADVEGVDFEAMMQILKLNYDGYHFSAYCPDIFNPFSLINAIGYQDISHKWFESGTPTFLLKKIRDTDEDIRQVLSPTVSTKILSNTSIADSNLISILYQTGYLTIKSYNKEERSFTLGIPNREVEEGIFGGLLPLYTGVDEVANDTLLLKLRRHIVAGEVDLFMSQLKSYLAGIPYALSNGKPEIYYENNLYLIFKMLGFDAQVETQTSQGRIDVTLKAPKYIYIIELKLDGKAAGALRQIQEHNYALPYALDDRQVISIGVNFSSVTRTIDDWVVG